MVDKPEASEKGQKAEIRESSPAPIVSIPNRDAEQTTGDAQTQNANKTRKYAKYIMWPFVAFVRLIRWLFLWANTHNGAITALATVMLAALTCFYVFYSRRQWKVMDDQLTQMKDQLTLQKRVIRSEKGGANVQINAISNASHEEGKLAFNVILENDGNKDAFNISICTKIDFRLPPLPPDKCDFFEPNQLNSLPIIERSRPAGIATRGIPIPHGYPISEAKYVSIWVIIRNSDYLEDRMQHTFCRQIPVNQVFLNARPLGVYLDIQACQGIE